MTNNRLQFFPLWLSLGWLLVATIFYLSLNSNPLVPKSHLPFDKVEHLLAYATVMGWFSQLYPERRQIGLLALALIGMGAFIEVLQGLIGQRNEDIFDVVANSLGVLIGWLLTRTWMGNVVSVLDRELAARRSQ